MFRRYASATIVEKISQAQARKMAVASNEQPVSFEYDPENFTYFRCRAITANETNGNGDLFPAEHLRQSYRTFVGVGLYKDHDSDSIDKAIGKVLHAEYIEPAEGNPYVETICAVDKQLAPDLARRVESGIATSVSMGCVIPGTPILLANGMQVAVEDIGPGTEIVTHSGAIRPVYATTKSLYNGEIVDISVAGLGTVSATANHPFLVMRRAEACACGCGESLVAVAAKTTLRNISSRYISGHHNKGRNGVFSKSPGRVVPEPTWVEASDIRPGDLLVSPAKGEVRDSSISRGMMRLAGYFIAEGCYLKRKGTPTAVQFHLASWEEDTLASEIVSLLKGEFGVSAKIYRSASHPNSITVQAYGKDLSAWFFKHCGQYSHTKVVSDEISAASAELQAEFVAAWLNGDGHADFKHRRYSGTTTSPVLAEQIRYMCSRSGIKARVERRSGKPGSGVKSRRDYYTVYLCGSDTGPVIGKTKWSGKMPARNSYLSKIGDNLVYRISSVSKRHYTGDVHNFSVKGDETYIAGGVSVHNCSVREAECGVPGCGNIAHNPQELCQHMMPGFGVKGRKNPDGSTVHEINRGIQFTELSLVTVPADPTARIFEVYAELHGRKASMSRAEFARELVRISESSTAEQLSGLHDYLVSKGVTFQNALGADAVFADDNQKAVEKKDELVDKKMGLSIAYTKGSSLGTSFFIASDAAGNHYRAAASDVLPIIVQRSIERGDAGVVTPERLISDLTQKYSSVGDFKAWAKRRRKKNRQAAERMSGGKEAEAKAADSVDTAKPEMTEEAAKPRVDGIKAAASDNGRSTMDKKETVELEKKAADAAAPAATADAAPAAAAATAVAEAPATETPAPVETEKSADEKGDIFAAFDALRKYVESKLSDLQKREAVKTESHANKGLVDEAGSDKSANVAGKGVEDPKTESPKGHMDKGASLEKKAMDKEWSVNPKELEKPAKAAKSDGLNLPPVVSLDRKEANSEAVDTSAGGKAGQTVKKYFGRLPSGGPGDAPKAMDAKSAKDPEKELLRKALAEEKAEKERLLEKERLQAVADKVYEVVTAMKEGNLLADGKEDAVIDTLTARFADIGQLENVKTLVAHLSPRRAAAPEADEKSETDVPVGQVVPQVFETVENTEDAVLKMASIWNR